MNNPTSIAVLCYNKKNLTEKCVESIIETGYQPSDITIIDNGSIPNTYAPLLEKYPGVNEIRQPENQGFAGGFNFGLKSIFSKGHQHALFLTNDTELTPGVAEQLTETAHSTGAGIVAPCLTYRQHHDKIDSIGGMFDRKNGRLSHEKQEGRPTLLKENEYIPGTALWISKPAFERLRGTDESYFMYWEDVDLSFRAHQLKIKQARCYGAKIRHGIGQTCHKKPIYTAYYYQRNRIRFCRTHLTESEWKEVQPIIVEELNQLEERWIQKDDQRRLQYLEDIRSELT